MTHEVHARPFPKFHNLGHPLAREDYDAEVEVTDKMDGSLGIGYVWDNKCYIATKGSFDSPQAIEANRLLHTYYPDWLPPKGVTPLWEIIYPENRIVLDYGELRYLSLIAGVDIHSGLDDEYCIWGSAGWPGASVNLSSYTSLGQAATSLPRENAEGWVVRYKDDNTRIKIKQDDYLAKHKLVFNLSEKTVWESLKDGRFDEYKKGMPDEFHDWMDKTASPFLAKFDDHIGLVYETRFIPEIDDLFRNRSRDKRKELAWRLLGAPPWVQKCLWCMWDNKDCTAFIYKQFEPKGQTKVAKP